jgi:hypothetical protein
MIGGWRLFVASLAQLAEDPRALVGVGCGRRRHWRSIIRFRLPAPPWVAQT